MKTKLIIATELQKTECWTNLPFIPRAGDWFNLKDIFTPEEIQEIKEHSKRWAGVRGVVKSIEYRHDENDFYVEVFIEC